MDHDMVSERASSPRFPAQGWIGLVLVAIFWPLNWFLPGLRTHVLFFPLWLGFILTVDGLVVVRKGTSLWTRGHARFVGLFLISMPAWWLFEVLNARVQNWFYYGSEYFTSLQFFVLSTLSFSTVVPAVFEASELMSTFFGRVRGPVIRPTPRTLISLAATGLVMLALMLAWPRYFFPFMWLSVVLILEPVNAALGLPSLARFTERGDWKPIVALWAGVLTCGFFWEMWNYFAYPKWIYTVPFVNVLHIFEMPLLGYGGYLPFALELYALYNFITGLLRKVSAGYLQFEG